MSHQFQKYNFTFIDLFAGIGGIRIPFEELGGKCVFSSEWDEAAQKTYEANFGERPQGDITTIASASIPNHDILLAGFPCQAFSIIGKMQGFNEARGTLFYNIEMILQEKRPQAFLLENVKQLKTHDKGKTFKVITEHLQNIGYHIYTEVLNALDFGLPQKRERTYIVGFLDKIHFDFPQPSPKKASLSDILEPDERVDKSLFASLFIQEKRLQKLKVKPFYPSIWHENKSGNISVLPYSCALRSGASYNYLLVNGIRRLSSRELLRLQGFPESFKIVVSHAEIRKQTGNSVPVPVVRAIAKQMLNCLLANVGAGSENI
ncbi:DNA cytosine methyltransferase [Capilliphycus salinus ALCB114379]|uniref:DNA cytosine methyltransferase n=1 Tax=Capilliphycus salinus TaxID=2768948 RepID=UPI0039A77AE4